jgi:hypothetical protein
MKNLAHQLPHPILLPTFLMKYALSDLRLEHKARAKHGLIPLEKTNVLTKKKSDTVFMFGSGPSVNTIPAHRWDAIARHDSIACNFWLFHSFVPTFFFYEAIVQQHSVAFDVFLRIAAARAQEYKDCIKIVTGLAELAPSVDFLQPESWAGDLHNVYTMPVVARDESEFSYGLRLIRSLGLFGVTERIRLIFKQASSITGLIAFALRMGYRQIVLCGVDLHTNEYFYQDPELYPDSAEIEFQPRHQPHLLVTPHPWKILTDAAVALMKREVLDPIGVKIYVENRSSRLWPAIPEAPQSLFN